MTDLSPAAILSEALNLPASDITPETSIESCAGWDSVAHFRVIAAIEDALGRELDTEEILSATTHDGIAQLLSR